jgi:hypothetical protein
VRLDSDGPLTSRAFPDTCEVPWRSSGVFRVHALHEDEPFSADVAADVHDEIEELARWLELELEPQP